MSNNNCDKLRFRLRKDVITFTLTEEEWCLLDNHISCYYDFLSEVAGTESSDNWGNFSEEDRDELWELLEKLETRVNRSRQIRAAFSAIEDLNLEFPHE